MNRQAFPPHRFECFVKSEDVVLVLPGVRTKEPGVTISTGRLTFGPKLTGYFGASGRGLSSRHRCNDDTHDMSDRG